MSNHLKKLLKKSQSQVSKLRDKVHDLKKEQIRKRLEIEKELSKHEKAPPKKSSKDRVIVEFSVASVGKATLVVIGLYLLARFLGEISHILIIVFVSIFLAAALDSIVDQLESKKIPRAVSILGIYLVFFLMIALFISTLIPLVADQTLELANTASDLITNLTQDERIWSLPYTESIREALNDFLETIDQDSIIANFEAGLAKFGSQLQNLAGNTFEAIKATFHSIFNFILVLVLTFFIIVDEKGIDSFFVSLFPSKHTEYIVSKMDAVKEKFGYWLRGQLKLMIVMTLITFIVLSLLGVEYALTLALLAGLTELLPVVGPIIAAIPAILVGLNESPMLAIWVLIAYIVIQQVEGNILVPIIMRKAVGLSPIVIIIAMLIGFEFLGLLGVIIAVPVATALSIFIKDYASKQK